MYFVPGVIKLPRNAMDKGLVLLLSHSLRSPAHGVSWQLYFAWDEVCISGRGTHTRGLPPNEISCISAEDDLGNVAAVSCALRHQYEVTAVQKVNARYGFPYQLLALYESCGRY
jgi:hypothetical protein